MSSLLEGLKALSLIAEIQSAKSGAIAGIVIDPNMPEVSFRVALFADGLFLGEADTQTSDGLKGRFRIETDGALAHPPYTVRLCLVEMPESTLASLEIPSHPMHEAALVRYEGEFIGIQDGALVGWANDRLHPEQPVMVELSSNGEMIGSALSDEDECFDSSNLSKRGFRLVIPKHMLNGRIHSVDASICGTSAKLCGSPFSFSMNGLNALQTRIENAERQIIGLKTSLGHVEDSIGRAMVNLASDLVSRNDAMLSLVRENIEREMAGLRALFGRAKMPAVERTNVSQKQHVVLEEATVGFGWFRAEKDEAGESFRWMGEKASLIIDYRSETSVLVTIVGHLVIDRDTLQDLRLSVNDHQVPLTIKGASTGWSAQGTAWAAAWSDFPYTMIKLSSRTARKPGNGDDRRLSVSIKSIRLEGVTSASAADV